MNDENHPNEPRPPQSDPVGVMKLPTMHLLVVTHSGKRYVMAKAVARFACVDWRSAKRVISEGDTADLYGVTRMLPPDLDGSGGVNTPTKGVYYIELEAVETYILRINTNRMRGAGNHDGADWVLAKQKEWKKALHQYETMGIAAKPGFLRDLAQLINACKALPHITDDGKRQAASAAIDLTFEQIGFPVPESPQRDLPLN